MALIIAMVMTLALALPAMAASITINANESTGGTVTTGYTYYELMKASIAEGGKTDGVSYYIPVSTEGTALKNLLAAVTYTKTVDDATVTVTPFSFTQSADGTRWNCVVSTAVADSDGEALATALNTAGIKAAALATDDFEQSNGTAVANDLDPGYYLITSTLGTKLVLQTLADETINTKNEYITDTKTASLTNMNVGDKVTYTITVHVPATAQVGEEITVHDTLDEHLAILDEDEAIAASATAYYITAKYTDTEDVDVTLSDGTKKAATETFAKKFTVTAGMLDKDVVLTYKAELLSSAADDTGYVNTTFANDDSFETVPSEVKVWTFDFDLDKTFTGAGSAANDFEATFELRTTASDTATAILFTGSAAAGYKKVDSDDVGGNKNIVVTGGDAVNINGLAAGTYYLVETATVDGYNMLTDPIEVKITDTTTGAQPDVTVSHTVEYKLTTDAASYTAGSGSDGKTIPVENNKGSVLPSTGGIGTTIFYALGAILVIGAGVLLVTRRRMNVE